MIIIIIIMVMLMMIALPNSNKHSTNDTDQKQWQPQALGGPAAGRSAHSGRRLVLPLLRFYNPPHWGCDLITERWSNLVANGSCSRSSWYFLVSGPPPWISPKNFTFRREQIHTSNLDLGSNSPPLINPTFSQGGVLMGAVTWLHRRLP